MDAADGPDRPSLIQAFEERKPEQSQSVQLDEAGCEKNKSKSKATTLEEMKELIRSGSAPRCCL